MKLSLPISNHAGNINLSILSHASIKYVPFSSEKNHSILCLVLTFPWLNNKTVSTFSVALMGEIKIISFFCFKVNSPDWISRQFFCLIPAKLLKDSMNCEIIANSFQMAIFLIMPSIRTWVINFETQQRIQKYLVTLSWLPSSNVTARIFLPLRTFHFDYFLSTFIT